MARQAGESTPAKVLAAAPVAADYESLDRIGSRWSPPAKYLHRIVFLANYGSNCYGHHPMFVVARSPAMGNRTVVRAASPPQNASTSSFSVNGTLRRNRVRDPARVAACRAAASAGLISASIAGWIGLRIGGQEAVRYVDDIATVAAAAIAAAACLVAARRSRGRMRLFWLLFAAATACWVSAEVVWAVYELILRVNVPVPSWADVGYLSAIVFCVAALVIHPALGRRRVLQVRLLVDGLLIATALLVLSWTLALGPVWRASDLSTAGGIVAVAYPFGDIVIGFFVVLTLRRMLGAGRLPLWILLGALLVMSLSDSAYSYMTAAQSYASGNLLDLGWIVAYLGIAVAASSARGQPQPAVGENAREHPTAAFLTPFVPALAALATAGVRFAANVDFDSVAMFATLALVLLVLARQALVVLEIITSRQTADADLLKHALAVVMRRPPANPESAHSRSEGLHT
jgi:hypothetical protein